MNKIKSSVIMVILATALITGCSEHEREKAIEVFQQIAEKISEQFMSQEQWLQKQRWNVIDERARSEIHNEIVKKLRMENKEYSEIIIYDVSIRKNNGYTNPFYESRGYKKGYVADFSAGLEIQDFFTKTSLTIEGDMRFWFKEETLEYETHLPDWRVTNKYTQSTGNGEKVIETIGNFLSE